MFERRVHGLGDLGNTLKVAEDLAIAVNVRFEDLPIVNARLPGRSGISQDKTAIQLFRRKLDGFTKDAVNLETNCAQASVESRIVILTSSRNFDQLCLHVLRDHADLFAVELASGKAGQRGGGRNHQCRRSGDPRANGRFRFSFDLKPAVRRKEAGQIGGQRMFVFPSRAKLVKAGKFFFAFCVNGFEANALSWKPCYATSRKNIDAKIDGDCAGMEKIQRPDVDGPASKIDTAGRMHDDGSVVLQVCYSVKNRAIWRNLL